MTPKEFIKWTFISMFSVGVAYVIVIAAALISLSIQMGVWNYGY